MRAFSAILIAAVLALSADAAAIDKRTVTAPSALCITNLNSVSAQITTVTNSVNAFTRAGGISAALTIHSQAGTLITLIGTATTNCCAIPGPTNVEDTEALLGNVGALVPKVVASLTAIVDKKPEFTAVILALNYVKDDIKNLKTKTAALNTCLVSKVPTTPPSYLITANGYVAEVDTAFANAYTAYGI